MTDKSLETILNNIDKTLDSQKTAMQLAMEKAIRDKLDNKQ